jgi:WD40 repeat protein
LISACHGGAWLWKVGKDQPVRPFPYDGAPIALAVSPDGRYLASGNLDSSVHLWRMDNEQNWQMSGYPSKVRMVAFDAPNRYIVTVTGEDLVLWDAKKFEGSSGKLLKGHLGWIQGLACHPRESLAATVGEDGLLHLWELKSNKPIVAAEVNKTGGLSAVAWDSRGRWLATGASHGTVTLFRVDGIGGAA